MNFLEELVYCFQKKFTTEKLVEIEVRKKVDRLGAILSPLNFWLIKIKTIGTVTHYISNNSCALGRASIASLFLIQNMKIFSFRFLLQYCKRYTVVENATIGLEMKEKISFKGIWNTV